MGIQGLTTFVANYSTKILDNFNLHDTDLVIDGNSLSIQLYQHVAKCNSCFGGDYNVYARVVKKFFLNLTKCNVTPYVIFDGGYEDKKLRTVLKRLHCRIVDASKIYPVNQSAFLVIPILLKDVFIEVLTALNIPVVSSEYEADQEIAIVARFLNCPVLSYDSDFFIYNVKYIPFPTLVHKPAVLKKDDDPVVYHLKCKIYTTQKFSKFFGIEEDVLPLLATLLGNDYVKRSVFSKFFHNLSESKSKRRNTGQCKISALIQWLKHESYSSAVEKVLSRFKLSRRNFVNKCIRESSNNYTTTYCDLLQYFGLSSGPSKDHKVSTSRDTAIDTEETESQSSSDEDSSSCDFVPYEDTETSCTISQVWIKKILSSCRVSAKFYDLLHRALYIGTPQVEDFYKTDANMSCIPILKFSYNVLKDFSGSKFTYEGRNELRMKRREIDCKESWDKMDLYWKVKEKQPGCEVFLYFLEKTIRREVIDKILDMPEDIQLIIITLVWISNSAVEHVEPTESNVVSIILCHIAMLLLKLHTDKEYTQFEFASKYSKSVKEWSTITKNTNIDVNKTWPQLRDNLSYVDSMLAINELLKYFDINKSLLVSPKLFKREVLHFFAEFQCCLQQLSYLNIWTSQLLKPCVISEVYNGTFIYNMYENLSKRNNPILYITQLLSKSPCVLSYFLKIMDVLGYDVTMSAETAPKHSNKKKKKIKKDKEEEYDSNPSKAGSSDEENDICDVNNQFYLLNVS